MGQHWIQLVQPHRARVRQVHLVEVPLVFVVLPRLVLRVLAAAEPLVFLQLDDQLRDVAFGQVDKKLKANILKPDLFTS
jgi:hypothetical protein